ncbi:hypothetical protein AAE478_002346 [Parahypoxylon ruwenzoriense]
MKSDITRRPRCSCAHGQAVRSQRNHPDQQQLEMRKQKQEQVLVGTGTQFSDTNVDYEGVSISLDELSGNSFAVSLQLRKAIGRTIAANRSRIELLNSPVVESLSTKRHT